CGGLLDRGARIDGGRRGQAGVDDGADRCARLFARGAGAGDADLPPAGHAAHPHAVALPAVAVVPLRTGLPRRGGPGSGASVDVAAGGDAPQAERRREEERLKAHDGKLSEVGLEWAALTPPQLARPLLAWRAAAASASHRGPTVRGFAHASLARRR